MSKSFFTNVFEEIGLKAVNTSPIDVKILFAQRVARFIAYGSTTLILILYLSSLGISDERSGLFMTLTLLGDVVMSLILTVIADGIGRRRMLGFGALLMTGSGIVFALSSNYWVLVLASVFGVISPSGNEIGPFRAIEESTIVHLIPSKDRTALLAWYTVFGFAGASIGIIVCGWVVQYLQTNLEWTPLASYRTVFWAYAVLGLVKFSLSLFLSSKCEIEPKIPPQAIQQAEDETQPLLTDSANGHITPPTAKPELPKKESFFKSIMPSLSPESAGLVFKLCMLFAFDSMASGLASASWLTYFFIRKFGLSKGTLGTIFSIASVLSTFSNLLASPLARRIGLIKTMVLTHVPASVALALIPIPSNVGFAIALLAFRASLNSMDQAPRQAFLAAAVLPEERTTVMGAVNVVKTLAQSVGPYVTGNLAQRDKFWIAFVLAGAMKLLYDVLILAMFLGYRTVEERAEARLDTPTQTNETEDSESP